MNFVYRPIVTWPGEYTKNRKGSGFSASFNATMTLLERELDHLNAKNVVIQLALDEAEIRMDGMPRANVRPRHPGVILAFDSKFGPLKYATDVFDKYENGWHENLRAIALGLEALRRVERYGITKRGEQYTGWKALGSGTPMGASAEHQMTVDEAARILVEAYPEGGYSADDLMIELVPDSNREWIKNNYRMAAKRYHPDAGGDPAKWLRIQKAYELLMAEGR